MLSRVLTVALLAAALTGCGGARTLEDADTGPSAAGPASDPTPSADVIDVVDATDKGVWKRPLSCTDRIGTGIHGTPGPITPRPDRTPEDLLRSAVGRAAATPHKPWDQLVGLTWEKRIYHERPKLQQSHFVFVGSRDGAERAAVYVDRRRPGPTWVSTDKELCVEPVPPRVTTTRTYDAPLTCPGEATRVATDPPKEDWGVAADGYLRHGLHEFLRWTRIEDFGWPAGLTYERRQPHTKGYADMVGTKDGIEQAVVTLERTATHDAWVMTGYAWCRSGP